MIHLHFEGTAEEVREQATKLLGLLSLVTTGQIQQAEEPKAKKGKTEKPAEAVSEPVQSTPATAAPLTPYNREQVSEMISKVVAKAGRNKAVELLAKYGAKSGKELKAEQYSLFLADGEVLLA